MKSEWNQVTPLMEKAPLKCDGKTRSFCKTMENALGDTMANAHSKGFVPIEITNFSDGSSRIFGVAYRKSHRDSGLMLNHCPFCGSAILWEGKPKKLAEAV